MNNDPNASFLGIVFLHFREINDSWFTLYFLALVNLPVLCIEFYGFQSQICVQSDLQSPASVCSGHATKHVHRAQPGRAG